jgi:hypothetical protein
MQSAAAQFATWRAVGVVTVTVGSIGQGAFPFVAVRVMAVRDASEDSGRD